jgi:hypothetical protein
MEKGGSQIDVVFKNLLVLGLKPYFYGQLEVEFFNSQGNIVLASD